MAKAHGTLEDKPIRVSMTRLPFKIDYEQGNSELRNAQRAFRRIMELIHRNRDEVEPELAQLIQKALDQNATIEDIQKVRDWVKTKRSTQSNRRQLHIKRSRQPVRQ